MCMIRGGTDDANAIQEVNSARRNRLLREIPGQELNHTVGLI